MFRVVKPQLKYRRSCPRRPSSAEPSRPRINFTRLPKIWHCKFDHSAEPKASPDAGSPEHPTSCLCFLHSDSRTPPERDGQILGSSHSYPSVTKNKPQEGTDFLSYSSKKVFSRSRVFQHSYAERVQYLLQP
jgi:hypothetical protein